MTIRKTSKGFSIEEVTVLVDGVEKEISTPVHHDGKLLTYEEYMEFKEMVDGAGVLYAIPDINKNIEKANLIHDFETRIAIWLGEAPYNVTLQDDGLYSYNLEYMVKHFNKDKGHWSFKCENCNTKVSSQTHKDYVVNELPYIKQGNSRFCSVACAEIVSREIFRNYLQEQDYLQFFK